jgi:hypothetical protein
MGVRISFWSVLFCSHSVLSLIDVNQLQATERTYNTCEIRVQSHDMQDARKYSVSKRCIVMFCFHDFYTAL